MGEKDIWKTGKKTQGSLDKMFKGFDDAMKESSEGFRTEAEKFNFDEMEKRKLPKLSIMQNEYTSFINEGGKKDKENEKTSSGNNVDVEKLKKQFMTIQMEILKSFAGNGFALTDNEKQELRDIDKQIKKLSNKKTNFFSKMSFGKKKEVEIENLKKKMSDRFSQIKAEQRKTYAERVAMRNAILNKFLENASDGEIVSLYSNFENYSSKLSKGIADQESKIQSQKLSSGNIDQIIDLVSAGQGAVNNYKNNIENIEFNIRTKKSQKREFDSVNTIIENYVKTKNKENAKKSDGKIMDSSNKTTKIMKQVTENMKDVDSVKNEENKFRALEEQTKNNDILKTDDELQSML